MTQPQKAVFRVDWSKNDTEVFEVQFNPTELSFDKTPELAEVPIAQTDTRQQQALHGGDEKLSLELFFDSTEGGTGTGATSVTELSDRVYQLVKISPERHTQPVVTFIWGHSFPGDALAPLLGNQRRTSFKGVVQSVSQKFTLFSPEGIPLRAKVNLTIKGHSPIEEQESLLGLNSPDKTHAHLLSELDRLSAISDRYYERPYEWRRIADHNDIDDPRRLPRGGVLEIPPIR